MQVDVVDRANMRFKECISMAAAYYKINLPELDLRFNLKGTTAAQFCRDTPEQQEGTWFFRINKTLLRANLESFLLDTIPHEVAHYVTRFIWGGKVRSHGKEWQSVMSDCFKVAATRCHNMDVSKVRRAPYIYGCACPGRTFQLTVRLHNSIQRGRRRRCKVCQGCLAFIRYEETAADRTQIPALFVSTAGVALSKDLIRRVKSVVDDNDVSRLVVDSMLDGDKKLPSLCKALSVPADCLVTHQNAQTLPGRVSHAILFWATDASRERQSRAEKALVSRGIIVRVLRIATV